MLPRTLLAEQVAARAPWLAPFLNLAPHVFFGEALGQGTLFALAGLVAVMLLVGWRTRWVTVASWVLLMSLQAGNPAVRNAGDDFFRLLLFWSMFLPLGTTWSVDARTGRVPAPSRLVTGGAPAALLLQIALIYPFNALYKDGVAWTTDFTALELFLGSSVWGSTWGQSLLEYPALLKAMTAATLGLERFGVLLAFCPVWHGPVRTLAVVLFAGFHGGILVLSQIHFFSLIGIVAWTVFLPSWFWARLDVVARGRDPRDESVVRQPMSGFESRVAVAVISYVFFCNVVGLYGFFGRPAPAVLMAPALALQLDQKWSMFSPEPAAWSLFLAARGETAAGGSVDLLSDTRSPRAGEPMLPPSGRYGGERWRAYLRYVRRLPEARRNRLGGRLAVYLASRWNAVHSRDDLLERVRLYRVATPIRLAGDPQPDGRRGQIRELLSVAVGPVR